MNLLGIKNKKTKNFSAKNKNNPQRDYRSLANKGIHKLGWKKEKPQEGTVTSDWWRVRLPLFVMKKRKTPRGDGNLSNLPNVFAFNSSFIVSSIMKKRKTPRGDGNSTATGKQVYYKFS